MTPFGSHALTCPRCANARALAQLCPLGERLYLTVGLIRKGA